MDIQAEKLDLIRQITEINSVQVLKKIKIALRTANTVVKPAVKQAMTKRLEESRQQIKAGKGVKVTLDDIWK